MSRKTLQLESVLSPDTLACAISNRYLEWELFRRDKLAEWKEIQDYVFATDTRDTSNSKLPWNNKTHIPKLCQIRDNLAANYMATLFPKRKWIMWEGDRTEDEKVAKKKAIEDYTMWSVDRSGFYEEAKKLVLDYIDYGNCFAMVKWLDNRVMQKDGSESVGYVGPSIVRVSPVDIVFDPTATDFRYTPKIIRSLVSMGEVKNMIEGMSNNDEQREQAQALWSYMRDIRTNVMNHRGTVDSKDQIYNVAGFSSFKDYLASDYVELLTMYGDMYDVEQDKLYKNHVIVIVDRHKILYNKPSDDIFGYPAIFHAGWRVRPDNLWAMGPLDNLVGLQYRINHLENMKADILDLTGFPLFKIKGYVEDFEWQPMEKIIVGDDGDVNLLSPDAKALQFDTQIAMYEQKMEEMAGSPKEAMGFRTPGEKTMYEVQRLEMAAGRIFQSKVAQLEATMIEPLLNAQLELARRNLDNVTIRSFDSEFKVAVFTDLSQDDITGNGRIRPIAARHFAEQANRVQNLSTFFGSPAGQDQHVLIHFSGEKLAALWEESLEIEDFHIVQPYVRIAEQADMARMQQAVQEQVAMEQQTPTGMYANDFDPGVLNEPLNPMGGAPEGQGVPAQV